MKKEKIKQALFDVIQSEAFEQRVGDIVLKAVGQALVRQIEIERGQPDGTVKSAWENWDVLEFLVRYIPRLEGAVRGVQKDAAAARNRATQTRDFVGAIFDRLKLEAPQTIRLQGKDDNDPVVEARIEDNSPDSEEICKRKSV